MPTSVEKRTMNALRESPTSLARDSTDQGLPLSLWMRAKARRTCRGRGAHELSAGRSIGDAVESVGATAPLLDSDIEKMDEMIRLNVGAFTRLAYAVVPGFVA